MYIWRNRNRRDNASHEQLGERAWAMSAEQKSHMVNALHFDEQLRNELEAQHIEHFRVSIESIMRQFIDTPAGKTEITLLRRELELYRRNVEDNLHRDERLARESETTRESLKLLFRQFGDKEYEEITREQLEQLLLHLDIHMRPKELNEYFAKCGFCKGRDTIQFEEFFSEFLLELEAREKKSFFARFIAPFFTHTQRLYSLADLEREEEKAVENDQNQREGALGVSVSDHLQRMLREMESRALLVEHAVYRATVEAMKEYRVSHPPAHVCMQCQRCFDTAPELHAHTSDSAWHLQEMQQRAQQDEKFFVLEQLLSGDLSRTLKAERLLFDRQLGLALSGYRAQLAVLDPFRPRLADPTAKRESQLARGQYVAGHDASKGVRALPRQRGLRTQHLAPLRLKPHNDLWAVKMREKQREQERVAARARGEKDAVGAALIDGDSSARSLQDVIGLLQRLREHVVDSVCASSHPFLTTTTLIDDPNEALGALPQALVGSFADCLHSHAQQVPKFVESGLAFVKFEWPERANRRARIKGEFTNWKEEDMHTDVYSNRFAYATELSIGRYRYRFVVDDVECVSAHASQCVDPDSPLGVSNELIVLHSPTTIATNLEELKEKQREALRKWKSTGTSSPPSRSRSQSFRFDIDRTANSSPQSKSPSLTPRSAMTPNALNCDDDENEFDFDAFYDNADHPILSMGRIDHANRNERRALANSAKNLMLRNLSLCDDGTQALVANLHANAYIRVIDLSYNSISDEGIQSLSSSLRLLSALHTLKLNGNGFGSDGARYLSSGLSLCPSMRTLELARNRIGDDGCEYLAEYLTYNLSVQTLFLDENFVSDDGMACLSEMLLHNRTLSKLSLMANKFSVIGIEPFAQMLQRNATLKTLNLAENAIGPDAVYALGEAMYFNDTLIDLSLARCSMLQGRNQRGLHSLCYAMKQNKHLRTLSLAQNDIKDVHVELIAESIAENETLLTVDLSRNSLSKHWFDREHADISTAQRGKLPSIARILFRNKKLQAQKQGAYDVDERRYIVEDVLRGEWTNRREWRAEREKESERQERKDLVAKEFERMRLEKEFVDNEVDKEMQTVRLYIEEIACKDFLQTTAHFIAVYLKELSQFDPSRFAVDRLHEFVEGERIRTAGSVGRERRKSTRIMQAAAASMSTKNGASPQRDIAVDWSAHGTKHGKDNDFAKPLGNASRPTSAQSRKSVTSNATDDRSQGSGGSKKRIANKRDRVRSELRAIHESAAEAGKVINPATLLRSPSIRSTSSIRSDDSALKSTATMKNRGLFGGLVSLIFSKSNRFDVTNEADILRVESFAHAHLSVVHALFCILEGDMEGQHEGGLVLHPQRLQQAMLSLCLPFTPSAKSSALVSSLFGASLDANTAREELQRCVDSSLIAGEQHMLGLHKVCDYLLRNTPRLLSLAPTLAFRLRSSLSSSPPLQEARAIILSFYRHICEREKRRAYRNVAANAPLFMCLECEKRFASQSLFEKHLRRVMHERARGREHPVHARLALRDRVFYSQRMFLQRVRFACTGSCMPAYFELFAEHKLPLDYMPQIMDKLGSQGRPLCVARAGCTVKVFDILGDFLSVSFEGVKGWLKYRFRPLATSSRATTCLGPIAGMDWESLQVMDEEASRWYRVNDNLPEEVELKVRRLPNMSAEVIGAIRKNQAVRVFSKIDCWLQIQYKDDDSAWVLLRSPLDEKDVFKNNNNNSSEGDVPRASSPVRRRHLERGATPITELECDVDEEFQDGVLTFEVEGKRQRVRLNNRTDITKYKITIWDEIRYGNAARGTSTDYFVSLPSFLAKRSFVEIFRDDVQTKKFVGDAMRKDNAREIIRREKERKLAAEKAERLSKQPTHEEQLTDVKTFGELGPSPRPIAQAQLWPIYLSVDESEVRSWDISRDAAQDVQSILFNPFGEGVRDDLYDAVDDNNADFVQMKGQLDLH